MKRRRGALLASVALIVGLAGCSSSGGGGNSKSSGSSATDPTAKYQTVQAGVLNVVTNLSLVPYRYQKNGKMGGFEIELTERIAHDLGFKSVSWSNIDWDSLITDIAAGKHDVAIAGINGWAKEGTPIYDVVQKRIKVVSFTRPYFLPYWALVTSKAKNPDLKSVDQLRRGMSIQVLDGTTEFFWAKQNLAPKGVDVRAGKDVSADFVAVESGLVDATIEEGTSLHAALQAHPGLQEGEPLTGLSAGFAWAVSHDRNALREAFDADLGKLLANGEYAALYKKFFPWLTPPTTLPDNSFVGS